MMPKFNLLLFLFCFTYSHHTCAMEFPNQQLRKEIAQALFNDMAAVDGVTAEVRNNTRKVTWSKFREASINNIKHAQSWQALYKAIDQVHYGIINRHSYVSVEKAIAQHASKVHRWPAIDISYSWPDLRFYMSPQHKEIKTINGMAVVDIFDTFYNWYCNDAHLTGCLALFRKAMSKGYSFADPALKLHVEYADGTSIKKTKITQKPSINEPDQNCQTHYLNSIATLRYAGQQACLFETDTAFIIKIFYFGSWGTSHHDIYCEQVTEAGMCEDIVNIRSLINQSAAKALIVDLQDNGGGSENTPWIAALSPDGFYDNLVQYKNLPHLQNSDTRSSAFYYSDRAEAWYQSIKKEVETPHVYLSARGDFCRGSKLCAAVAIASAPTTIKFSELRLVVNHGCVSSCDDLVWRAREYADAKTYGQLPATDGAYARLNGYLILTPGNKIKSIIVGEDQSPDKNQGTLLVSWRLPISKTVSQYGDLLEGDTSVLDSPLPITVDNFSNLQLHNLKRALEF